MSILLVDGAAEQAPLATLLRKVGYIPVEARESGDALREVLDRRPHLIIVAQEAPPVEGVDLLPLLRRLTEVPIVVIGPDSEGAMVQALFQGADAYIKRPVDLDELLARIRAALRRRGVRRPPGTEQSSPQFTDLSQLQIQLANLTSVETKLLVCLLDRQNSLVPREELMMGVWGERGKPSSLRFYIRRLRQKLGTVLPVEILNLKGRGYRLLLGPADTAGAKL